MYGLSSSNGRRLGGVDHLRQSIRDILITPIGSRVMRRDYGSGLFELVDAPLSSDTRLAIIAATATALINWEPRIDVEEVSVTSVAPGRIEIDLRGRYLPGGEDIEIDGIALP